MDLINLTPHTVTLYAGDEVIHRFPIGGPPARVEYRDTTASILFEGRRLPVTERSARRVKNLPAARPGVLLIVSRLVAEALPERPDLVVPDDFVFKPPGRVVGCRSLAHLSWNTTDSGLHLRTTATPGPIPDRI